MERARVRQWARELRRDQTTAEARLWEMLRGRKLGGWKWKRQVPRGPYVVDFLCMEASLVIELDGGHHAEATDYDTRRTAYLQRGGLKVLRFWNFAVIEGRTGVCDAILAACGGEAPHLTSPRERGEEQVNGGTSSATSLAGGRRRRRPAPRGSTA